jgi:hypothetical protein
MKQSRDPAYDMALAVEQARRSYRALIHDGALPPDTVLARSRDYQALLHAGRTIRSLGTRDAFQRTLKRLYADDAELSAQAARDLLHLWAGMIDWPDPDAPLRLN